MTASLSGDLPTIRESGPSDFLATPATAQADEPPSESLVRVHSAQLRLGDPKEVPVELVDAWRLFRGPNEIGV